ncbi:MAG: phosphoribosyltransferase family protein [Xanthobacteraceae bacterium]
MAKINPQIISGNWSLGVALDLHTLSSVYLGVNEFGHEIYDTTRSELGELLYRLKYRGDLSATQEIVTTAENYLRKNFKKFELIVPVPPSGARAVQPVITLAKGIASAFGTPVAECVTLTRTATALKGVIDPDQRQELLAGLHAVDAKQTKGKNVLLFDDLYRSGSTLNAIADLLKASGGVSSVQVLTITRTRSNQ